MTHQLEGGRSVRNVRAYLMRHGVPLDRSRPGGGGVQRSGRRWPCSRRRDRRSSAPGSYTECGRASANDPRTVRPAKARPASRPILIERAHGATDYRRPPPIAPQPPPERASPKPDGGVPPDPGRTFPSLERSDAQERASSRVARDALCSSSCSTAQRIHDDTDRSSAPAASRILSMVSGGKRTGTTSVSLAERRRPGPCGV